MIRVSPMLRCLFLLCCAGFSGSPQEHSMYQGAHGSDPGRVEAQDRYTGSTGKNSAQHAPACAAGNVEEIDE
jgi:hypothetical protein